MIPKIEKRVVALIALSIALQSSFTFLYVDPSTVLSGDMKLFWERALNHINGDIHGVLQWSVWPVMPHIIFSWLIRFVDFIGLETWRLNAVITIGIVINSCVVALVYGIAEELAKRCRYTQQQQRKAATITATLYAISLPHILLSAHILSEMISIPLFMFGLYTIIKKGNKWLYIALGAFLFAASALVRPAFGLEGLAMVAIIATMHSDGFIDWIKKAAVFTSIFGIMMSAGLAETKYISNGNINSIGANGALVFYIHQCNISGWLAVDKRLLKKGEMWNHCDVYKKFPPPYAPKSMITAYDIDLEKDDECNGTVGGSTMIGIYRSKHGRHPYEIHGTVPWDSDYFWNRAFQCIEEEGLVKHTIRIVDQTKLLFQFIYPSRAFIDPVNQEEFRPAGKFLLSSVTLWNCIFGILALIIPWVFVASRKRTREEKFIISSIGMIPVIVLLTCAMFALDGRYIIPTLFVAYTILGLSLSEKEITIESKDGDKQ